MSTIRTESPSIAPESSLLAAPLAPLTDQPVARPVSGRAWLAYLELSKPRILVLILLCALAGYGMATGNWRTTLCWHLTIGIALLAAGTGALNQYFERDIDGEMRRTERRPLPAKRLKPSLACLFGVATSVAGSIYLAALINPLSGLLGVFTVASYIFLYTPLKRKTPLSTMIGAIPGAMPPLMGWVAVHNKIGVEAGVLFLIMFLWQFPHFLAIAWMYRDDYARAGIRMLPIVEPDGISTGRQIVLYALVLVPVSLLPTLIGLAGISYFFGALILSLAYLYFGILTAKARTGLQAKRLLQASVLYLPLLFALMLLDKVAR